MVLSKIERITSCMTNPEVRRKLSLHVKFNSLVRLLFNRISPTLFVWSRAMHRCSCSLHALEIFVNDLSGLTIQRSKSRFLSTPNRAFSTRTRYRQIATSHVISERGDHIFPLNAIVDDANTRETKRRSKENDVNAPSLSKLDEHWNSDSVEPAISSKNSEGSHDEFKSAEDVVTQFQSAEMKKMAKKMKGLEKKRKRKVEGVFAPKKRENEVIKRGEAIKEGAPSSVTVGGGTEDEVADEDGGRRTRRERRAQRPAQAGKDSSAMAKLEKPAHRLKNPREEGRHATKVVKTKQRNGPTRKIAESMPKTTRAKSTAPNSARSFRAAPDREPKAKEIWQIQKASLERKFGEQGWQPKKRLSPDTLEGIRALHNSDANSYNTETLAKHFQITPEAIRRILKSKWRPNEDEAEDRRQRWEKRGVKKWTEMAESGMRPPSKWRALGVKSKVQLKKRDKRDRKESRGYGRSDEGNEAVGESFAGRIL